MPQEWRIKTRMAHSKECQSNPWPEEDKMTDSENSPFPRWFLIGAFGLVFSAMLFAFVARQTDIGALRVNRTPDIAQLTIRFDEQADGSVLVRRQADDAVLEILPRDGSTFLRGVLRSLHRERAMKHVERGAPFVIARRAGSRHALLDPLTGSRIEMDGFGPSHSLAISQLMDHGLAITRSAVLAGQNTN
jgi:putative photosynthetic complex assembly protein